MEFNIIEQLQNQNSITSWITVFVIAAGASFIVGWLSVLIVKSRASIQQRTVDKSEIESQNPIAVTSYRTQLLQNGASENKTVAIKEENVELILKRLTKVSNKLEQISSHQTVAPELTPEEYAAGLDLDIVRSN